jgi:FkbM family methyltransferase
VEKALPFVSYAQNLEDVMLYRALKHIEKGFYIDVGAHDPVVDSVTKAFYDRGWRGINIEPVAFWYEKLVAHRPEDINLQLAAWDREGSLTLYEVVGTGLSTLDGSIAQNHTRSGFDVRLREVRGRPLDAICTEHGVSVVHFLKIDVEGSEEAVLRGINLCRIRPWIIVVEAMEPNSTVPAHLRWEHLLVSRGYDHVYFDGLNRFYLALEHEELRPAFATPPNIFDNFRRVAEEDARERLAEVRGQVERLEAELKDARARGEQLEAELIEARTRGEGLEALLREAQERCTELEARLRGIQEHLSQVEAEANELRTQSHHWRSVTEGLKKELECVYASRSWRLPGPLRRSKDRILSWARGAQQGFGQHGHRTKRSVKASLVKLLQIAAAHPRLKALGLRIVRLFPNIEARLRSMVVHRTEVVAPSPPRPRVWSPGSAADPPPDLSEEARRLYKDLVAALGGTEAPE